MYTESIEKRHRRTTQINAVSGLRTFDMFGKRNAQSVQNNPKRQCGKKEFGNDRRAKYRKEKDRLQLGFVMLMLAFERMGMYYNHTIYHMRMSKECDTSQISNEEQRQEYPNYTFQFFFQIDSPG